MKALRETLNTHDFIYLWIWMFVVTALLSCQILNHVVENGLAIVSVKVLYKVFLIKSSFALLNQKDLVKSLLLSGAQYSRF